MRKRSLAILIGLPVVLYTLLGCLPEDQADLLDALIKAAERQRELTDTDGDGTPDVEDGCPEDADKLDPGACGCGIPDLDTDEDGVPDCLDGCPEDPFKTEPGDCGCGFADEDLDEDGVSDCLATEPNEPAGPLCTVQTLSRHTDAADRFERCFWVQGRVGSTSHHGNFSSELELSKRSSRRSQQADFDWDNGGTHTFAIEWNGQRASFALDEVLLEDFLDCAELNALSFRCRAKHGSVLINNLAVNGTPLGEDVFVQAGGEAGKLSLLRLVCTLGEPFTLTGDVSLKWDRKHRPRNWQLAFQIAAGHVDVGDPIVDCNGNGVPDTEDLAAGTSLDCNQNGVPDECDLEAGTSNDENENDIPDECEGDCNGNGVPDDQDLLDGTSADCDQNGEPDECQADTDGDGLIDACDGCPENADKTEPGACGCDAADVDSDGDGVLDCDDACPDDPNKTEAGACGCGTADVDSDGDGVPDCEDGCPDDPTKSEPGACGCGTADLDTDGDGVFDCDDACPDDPDKSAPGACGCGIPDLDSDEDGVPDCQDGCPNDPYKTAPGDCGCGVADADANTNGISDCLEEPGSDDCTTAHFEDDAAAEDGFDGCFTAVGRIGSVNCSGGHTYELGLGAWNDDPSETRDFLWLNYVQQRFELKWNGEEARFKVRGLFSTTVEESFSCTDLNALLIRCHAAKGHIDVYDLELNGEPLDATVGASEDGDHLNLLRVECALGQPFELTGRVRMHWSFFHRPKNSQLAFWVSAGHVDGDTPFDDCNNNGVADELDLSTGTSADCNGNGRPDVCDVTDGTSQDVNGNGVPDECEADCNDNGVPDSVDIATGTSEDCDVSGVPDECEIADGTVPDCDGNGVPATVRPTASTPAPTTRPRSIPARVAVA
jgi:hypothetical protein